MAVTGVLTATAAVQGPDSLLFQHTQPVKAAGYDTAAPTVTEVVVEVPVPSPLPPTHVPAAGGGGGGGGGGVVYQAPAAAPPATVLRPVAPPKPVPVPVPTAVSSGSVPH
jgi:hypothetical protein